MLEHFFSLKGKQVTVVGLARSGLSSAILLESLGARVSVTDSASNQCVKDNAAKLEERNIKVEIGRHSEDFVKGSDFIVVSPSVTWRSQAFIYAKKHHIPVISEIELAFRVCASKNIIAVTGSNGKSTVSTLISEVLRTFTSRDTYVLGNIGRPFSSKVQEIKEGDFVVLEVSSFQLERIVYFKPKVSVILNISINHLDRHSNMQEYINQKKRIFMNQDNSDFLVLNCKDTRLEGFQNEASCRVSFFGNKHLDRGLNINQLAVVSVAEIFGVDIDKCDKVFAQFMGLEHRLEFVKTINGIDFVNDSKATTVEAARFALNSLKKPVILIAGGRDKGSDFSLLNKIVKEKVKSVILVGEAKEKIRNAFRLGEINTDCAKTFEEAVSKAFLKAKSGDCVLLSPMCASFDMFKDFEERGRVFKQIVNSLTGKF